MFIFLRDGGAEAKVLKTSARHLEGRLQDRDDTEFHSCGQAEGAQTTF